jgi:hypothetical protein
LCDSGEYVKLKQGKSFDIIPSENYKKVQSVFSNRTNHGRWGILRKLARLKTAARFFPDKEFEATTQATQIQLADAIVKEAVA